LFFIVADGEASYARMLVPVEPYQLGLLFAGKGRNLAIISNITWPNYDSPYLAGNQQIAWWVQQKNTFSAVIFLACFTGQVVLNKLS
jgi:hypothetical protein